MRTEQIEIRAQLSDEESRPAALSVYIYRTLPLSVNRDFLLIPVNGSSLQEASRVTATLLSEQVKRRKNNSRLLQRLYVGSDMIDASVLRQYGTAAVQRQMQSIISRAVEMGITDIVVFVSATKNLDLHDAQEREKHIAWCKKEVRRICAVSERSNRLQLSVIPTTVPELLEKHTKLLGEPVDTVEKQQFMQKVFHYITITESLFREVLPLLVEQYYRYNLHGNLELVPPTERMSYGQNIDLETANTQTTSERLRRSIQYALTAGTRSVLRSKLSSQTRDLLIDNPNKLASIARHFSDFLVEDVQDGNYSDKVLLYYIRTLALETLNIARMWRSVTKDGSFMARYTAVINAFITASEYPSEESVSVEDVVAVQKKLDKYILEEFVQFIRGPQLLHMDF